MWALGGEPRVPIEQTYPRRPTLNSSSISIQLHVLFITRLARFGLAASGPATKGGTYRPCKSRTIPSLPDTGQLCCLLLTISAAVFNLVQLSICPEYLVGQ
jgi:hypothetical protein